MDSVTPRTKKFQKLIYFGDNQKPTSRPNMHPFMMVHWTPLLQAPEQPWINSGPFMAALSAKWICVNCCRVNVERCGQTYISP